MLEGLPPNNASHRVRLVSDERRARAAADLIAESFEPGEAASTAFETGETWPGGGRAWLMEAFFGFAPDEEAIRALIAVASDEDTARSATFGLTEKRDWVANSLAGLKPVRAGRFLVHGRHDRARVGANDVAIEIEAGLAFGTGHHGTTRGCLVALDRICKSRGKVPLRVLDLGTGSGVLAIAAARVLRRRVLATDIDAAAVRVARDNARRNRVGPQIEVLRANGPFAPAIRAGAPYDLVFANILLEPLQRLAAPLTKVIAPGGRIVLSGLLTSQANAAIAAYRALALERRLDIDGWTTLVLKRASAC